MAHSRFFKEKLKEKLRRKLRKYGIRNIESESKATILVYNPIYWDFSIKLRQHNIRLLIEIETDRVDPITNLAKTLLWFEENESSDVNILIHFFDKNYFTIHTSAKDYCAKMWQFLDKQYKSNLKYSIQYLDGLARAAKTQRKFRGFHAICNDLCNTCASVVEGIISGLGTNS